MGPPHDRRFKSKVTIDGKSYETSDCYTNLKDAEHAAAKVAFESMSLHETQEDEGLYKTLLQKFTQKGGFHIPTYETDKSGPLHMPTFLTKVEIGGEIFEGQKAKSKKLSEMNAAKAAYNSLIEPMLHLYKSRLQNYAQNRNLKVPAYTHEVMGPPHARRFMSKVNIDGTSYETSDWYSNLKEAEHAAAKVAFETLSLPETQEDVRFYKSLLQEHAQKGCFHFPKYETDKSGPPHQPTFISKVKIAGEVFEGQKAKSKKLAEMSAAKAAYNSLIKCQQMDNSLKVPPVDSQAQVTDEVQQNVMEKVVREGLLDTRSSNDATEEVQIGRKRGYSLKVLPVDSQPKVMDEVQQNVMEKVEQEALLDTRSSKEVAEEVERAHKTSCISTFSPAIHDMMRAWEVPPLDFQPQIMDNFQLKVMENGKTEVLKTNNSNKVVEAQNRRGIQYSAIPSPGFQNTGVPEEPKEVLKFDDSIGKHSSGIQEIDIKGETVGNSSSYDCESAWLQPPISACSSPKDVNGVPALSSAVARLASKSSTGVLVSASKRLVESASISRLAIPEGATNLPVKEKERLPVKLETLYVFLVFILFSFLISKVTC